MGLAKLTSSKGFKNFMAKLYGLGASVVILGALFKINHYPYANIMLILGMGTEAIIFFFSAFEPPHVEPDWSLVYPELEDQYHSSNKQIEDSRTQKHAESASVELDNLLKASNFDPSVLRNLGDGFNKLNTTVSNLNDITAIGTAGKDLTESLKMAGQKTDSLSENLSSLNTAYENQIRKTNDQFQALAEKMTKVFELQLQKANEQNEALAEKMKKTFEMQIQKSNEQNTANDAIANSMKKFIESMQTAIECNEKYQKESAKLAENLSEINQVYGNMLGALNFNKKN